MECVEWMVEVGERWDVRGVLYLTHGGFSALLDDD